MLLLVELQEEKMTVNVYWRTILAFQSMILILLDTSIRWSKMIL